MLRKYTFGAWTAYGWKDDYGIVFLLSELALVYLICTATAAEWSDPAMAMANAKARERASTGKLSRLELRPVFWLVTQLTVFTFVCIHKGSARLIGEGMCEGGPEGKGGTFRQYELTLPGCIIAHEAFQDWPAALITIAFYAICYWVATRSLKTAIGRGVHPKAARSHSWQHDNRLIAVVVPLFSMVRVRARVRPRVSVRASDASSPWSCRSSYLFAHLLTHLTYLLTGRHAQ